MHDHPSHPMDRQWATRARTGAAALLHRIKPLDADTPLLAGVVLTAVTLCAASTCVWMLPITGRSSASNLLRASRQAASTRSGAASSPMGMSRSSMAQSSPKSNAAAGGAAPSVAAVDVQDHGSGRQPLHRLAMAAADVLHQVKVEWTDAAAPLSPATPPAPSTTANASPTGAAHTADKAAPIVTQSLPQVPASTPRAAAASHPQRVVYLVDDSGSLLDSLPRVIKWLGDSLDQLKSDQQFTVLFFRHGRIIEAPPTGLKKASFAAKVAVWTWMQPDAGHVAPQGRSDLLAAIRAAMRYDAQKIVILSDDNVNRLVKADAATDPSGGAAILDEIAAMLRGRSVRIDTVQFYYRDQAGALEAIADRFGGRYTFVRPVSRPAGPDIAPLIELSIAK